ncbi:MAG: metal-sulfur cluster assembly factor [Flavobacteriales bacterium]|nr:metal-sulfur cluster assembly factor [Flavobacteriales bacterium]
MEDKIYELLKTVIDPEVDVNVVDLGLIYDIKIDGNDIIVVMTLSTPGCPLGDTIMENISEVIVANIPDVKVDVQLVWEPTWTPELISPAGKEVLGM